MVDSRTLANLLTYLLYRLKEDYSVYTLLKSQQAINSKSVIILQFMHAVVFTCILELCSQYTEIIGTVSEYFV